jgi:CP family cyanate transporter-like MFS transporter
VTPRSPGRGARVRMMLAPAAALVLTALCLRAPFSAVGPVLGELGAELSIPQAALSVLATLPLLVFGLVSPTAPALAARLGVHRAVLAGLLAVGAGIALRLAGTWGLYAGTVLLTAGIAVGNVLVPAAARAVFGDRAAPVLGATTATLGLSASLGVGLAQPLADAAGSAVAGLAFWLAPVLVAVPAMALLARRWRPAAAPAAPRLPVVPVLRDRVALAVTAFFGLQSLAFYVMLSWLAGVLEDDAGTSPVAAGALVAAAAAFGAPCALAVPPLAARQHSQVAWVVGATALSAAGILGLLVAPTAAPAVWVVLWGLGTGTAFPLALTLVLVRTRDAAQTGRLSAAAQSVGYLLAAAGPLTIGLLHDATGGWRAGLAVLMVLQVLQLLAGLYAGRPGLVTEGSGETVSTAEVRR